MSTFVLKREYALQMPTSYVDIDRDEMEYVDGGFYISNYNLKVALCTVMSSGAVTALNMYVVSVIANTVSRVVASALKWAGVTFGGFVGGVVGWVVGNFTGYAIGIRVGQAILTGKGLELSWDGLTVR